MVTCPLRLYGLFWRFDVLLGSHFVKPNCAIMVGDRQSFPIRSKVDVEARCTLPRPISMAQSRFAIARANSGVSLLGSLSESSFRRLNFGTDLTVREGFLDVLLTLFDLGNFH